MIGSKNQKEKEGGNTRWTIKELVVEKGAHNG